MSNMPSLPDTTAMEKAKTLVHSPGSKESIYASTSSLAQGPPTASVRWFRANTPRQSPSNSIAQPAVNQSGFSLFNSSSLPVRSLETVEERKPTATSGETKEKGSTAPKEAPLKEPQPDLKQAKLVADQSSASTANKNILWMPFPLFESQLIEEAYLALVDQQRLKSSPSTSLLTSDSPTKVGSNHGALPSSLSGKPKLKDEANSTTANASHDSSLKRVQVEDALFEVDIFQRIIYPIYYEGASYQIRRAIWFQQDSSGKWTPAEESLSQQIEDGYMKFQPWRHFEESAENVLTSEEHKTADRFKWTLFGPHKNNYVLYSGHHNAWLFSDSVTSKFVKAIFSRLSSENLGGIRLVRGYHQVENMVKTQTSGKRPTEETMVDDVFSGVAADAQRFSPDVSPSKVSSPVKLISGTTEAVKPYRYKHLVFVCHGIGQKMQEKTTLVNFIEDVGSLRSGLKSAYLAMKQQESNAAIKTTSSSATSLANDEKVKMELAAEFDVMVIPVQWRKRLKFDMGDANYPTINDINLESIPSLRSILSHVLLDVLLYMTPQHRSDIIVTTIKEMNHLYKLFIERHPYFLEEGGKVHLFAHSLGSLISFDILCHHNFTKFITMKEAREAERLLEEEERGIDLSSLSKKKLHFGGVADSSRMNQSHSSLVAPAKRQRMSQPIINTASAVEECLQFPIEKYFAVGSPLGLFSLLKGSRLSAPVNVMTEYIDDWVNEFAQRKRTANQTIAPEKLATISRDLKSDIWSNEMNLHPDLKHMYHLFHPNDPIAYRIEPLISRTLASNKPAVVPYTKGGLTGLSVNISGFANKASEDLSGLFGSLKNTFVASLAFRRALQEAQSLSSTGPAPILHRPLTPESSMESQTSETSSLAQLGSTTLANDKECLHAPEPDFTPEENLTTLNPRKRRIDFAIQENVLENPYLGALPSHLAYWKDADCAMFILKELYEEL